MVSIKASNIKLEDLPAVVRDLNALSQEDLYDLSHDGLTYSEMRERTTFRTPEEAGFIGDIDKYAGENALCWITKGVHSDDFGGIIKSDEDRLSYAKAYLLKAIEDGKVELLPDAPKSYYRDFRDYIDSTKLAAERAERAKTYTYVHDNDQRSPRYSGKNRAPAVSSKDFYNDEAYKDQKRWKPEGHAILDEQSELDSDHGLANNSIAEKLGRIYDKWFPKRDS